MYAEGYVESSVDRMPIARANISVPALGLMFYADDYGFFIFDGGRPGLEIKASALGYNENDLYLNESNMINDPGKGEVFYVEVILNPANSGSGIFDCPPNCSHGWC